VFVGCGRGESKCSTLDGRVFCSTLGDCRTPSSIFRAANVTLTLQGPSVIVIEQGASYGLCPQRRPLSLVCDAGATALDSIEGVMTSRVEACSSASNRYRVSRFGLQGCRINTTAAPQDMSIRFSYHDSAAVVYSVTRCDLVLG